MKLIHLIACLLFLANPVLAKKIFNSKSFNLDNGLKVIVIENKRAAVATQMIWYKFGSGVEENTKSGLAHFMEHLMFKGTKKFPKDYYSNFISRIGGSENAFTSYDFTAYYQIFPSNEIEKIIEMEADRMKNLILNRKIVEIEKKVILEERFQRVESDPSSLLDESIKSSLFPNSYYGRPIIGWKKDIKNLNYSDVKKFYKKFYSPNNAILVLSGDISLNKAKKLTKKYFGEIKSSGKINSIKVSDPDLKTSVIVELNHPDVKQPIWKKLYRVDSYTKSIKNGIAFDLGLKILAGGTTSILYNELVEKKKEFSMVGGFYQGLARESGYAYLYAIPKKNMDIKKINEKITKEIFKAVEEKITPELLNIEKKKYFFNSVYGMDGVLKPAEIIGEALTVGLKLNDLEFWNDNLKDIDVEVVKKELRKFAESKNFVLGGLKN